jgi:hypothetical protein
MLSKSSIVACLYPQAKQTDPTPAIDAMSMRRIEQNGFIKALYER